MTASAVLALVSPHASELHVPKSQLASSSLRDLQSTEIRGGASLAQATHVASPNCRSLMLTGALAVLET